MSFIIVAISLSPPVALAQTVPSPAIVRTVADIRAEGGVPPALRLGPSGDERSAFFAEGIQGEVTVAGIVGIDGKMHEGSVAMSSRSKELDDFAQGLVTKSIFDPAKDKDGNPVPARVRVPVFLWKDTLAGGLIF